MSSHPNDREQLTGAAPSDPLPNAGSSAAGDEIAAGSSRTEASDPREHAVSGPGGQAIAAAAVEQAAVAPGEPEGTAPAGGQAPLPPAGAQPPEDETPEATQTAQAAEQSLSEEPEEALEEDSYVGPVEPIEEIPAAGPPTEQEFRWYILKVQVNREDSIREALQRRVARAGLDAYFGEIVIPTEDVVEFTKSGKKRTVKRKLYPGYIMVSMVLNDDSWFLVRETPGIGDFTGSAGKPTPMDPDEVRRIIRAKEEVGEAGEEARIAIPFSKGDRVRVKEGYFQNFEGDVDTIDSTNGRVTVMIHIFGRATPVELQHWQMERV